MSYLSMMFIGWYLEKKDEYNILEIGSGSGDLMLKIFNIRDQVLSDEASLDIHKKFFESLRFNIVDFKEMTDVQIEKLGHLRASQVKFLNLETKVEADDIGLDFIIAGKSWQTFLESNEFFLFSS